MMSTQLVGSVGWRRRGAQLLFITAGGDAPNVVPDFAEVYYYIRHPSSETVAKLYPRLVKCARAGEIATETKLEIVHLGGTIAPDGDDIAAIDADVERLLGE